MTRVAVISIIVEDSSYIEELNKLLFSYRDYIIGRMGIPYKKGKVNIICVATEDVINALTGKIGRLKGISAKTNYSNVFVEDDSTN